MNEPLGPVIRRERERRRLTQEELGAKLGVTRATVGNWERGDRVPRNRLGALADILGIGISSGPDGQLVAVVPDDALDDARDRAGVPRQPNEHDHVMLRVALEQEGLTIRQREQVMALVEGMVDVNRGTGTNG